MRLEKLKMPMNKKVCKICFEEYKISGFSSIFNPNQVICYSCLLSLKPKFISFEEEGVKCLSKSHIHLYKLSKDKQDTS